MKAAFLSLLLLLALNQAHAAKCPKRGLAYMFPSATDMQAVKNGISWWVNWASQPAISEQVYRTLGIEFVPMLWGEKSFQPTPIIPAGAKYLLGFNEPNFFVQANMPANKAASLWSRVQQAGKQQKLVSPALNYCGGGCFDTDPFVYLDKFFASCKGCRVDYIAMHWYGCTAASLKDILKKYKKYGKKIWVTEIACGPWDGSFQNNPTFHVNYMKEAVKILENDPMVFRYAWFSGRNAEIPLANIFQAGSGQLSTLGKQYLQQPCGPSVASALQDDFYENAFAVSDTLMGQNSSNVVVDSVSESKPEQAYPNLFSVLVGILLGIMFVVGTLFIMAITFFVVILKKNQPEERA